MCLCAQRCEFEFGPAQRVTPAKRVRVAPRLARPPHTEHACACAGRADRGPKGRGSHEARLAPPQPGGAAEQTRRHGATRPIHTHTPIHTHQRELVAQVEDGVEAQVGGGEGNEGPHRAARARLGVTPLAHGDGGRGAGPRGWRAGGVGGWAPRRERRRRCVETNAGECGKHEKGVLFSLYPAPPGGQSRCVSTAGCTRWSARVSRNVTEAKKQLCPFSHAATPATLAASANSLE